MAARGDYGKSEATQVKDIRFKTCCQLWGQWVKDIWKKFSVSNDFVVFYDLYGGPGIDADGRSSLCVLAHRAMKVLNIPHRIYAVEIDDATWSKLYQVTRNIPEIVPIQGDHNKVIQDYLLPAREKPQWDQYGMIRIDPTGVDLSDTIPTTLEILDRFPRMDVLVNISASNYKRAESTHHWDKSIFHQPEEEDQDRRAPRARRHR